MFDSCRMWRAVRLLVLYGAVCFPVQAAAAEDSTDGAPVSQPERALTRFEAALKEVQPLIARYGYGAAAAAVFAEGMGVPAPGQTLLIASALEATQGRLSILWVLLSITLAAALGNSVGYVIGRWGGRNLLNKLKVNSQRQHRLDDLVRRRGGVVILFGRFVDGLRQLNGIVAGILQMPWWRFTAYNISGAILWTFTWGLGSYYLERDIGAVAEIFQRHRKALLALTGAALVALLIYLLKHGKEARERR